MFVETGSSIPLGGNGNMEANLLTHTGTLIDCSESLLENAKNNGICHDSLCDIKQILTAAQQLLVLFTPLFSNKNYGYGQIDVEAFTVKIRHDSRNALSAIKNFAEILLEDIDENHRETRVYIRKILTSARHILAFIDERSYLYAAADNVVGKPSISEKPLALSTNQKASLLVVDDQESNRESLSRRLNKQGFEVKVADNGRKALQIIGSQQVDLILLDINMPEMDGYQVLEVLQKDNELRRLPVIMISALDEIDSVVRCIQMGAVDYLQRPFHQVILNAKISATLERKRLFEESERLLLNILPQEIAEQLKDYDPVHRNDIRRFSKHFEQVTVLFSDLVGFTELSTSISADELVEKLNHIFSAFDDLTKNDGLEKIKTIGDAYMLVGGLPSPRSDHAEAVANLALKINNKIDYLNKKNHENFKIRIGIHTGPVVAGVIGKHKFNYDLWGETVNIASRMESQGIPGEIQVSETTYNLIKNKFIFELRGPIEVKGKGKMVTYLLKANKNRTNN